MHMTLPDDLWRVALCWLPLEDAKTMSATCNRFRQILLQPPFHRLWQHMVVDTTRARWAHTRTRALPAVVTLIPRVLSGRIGAKLFVLQLGHRFYPPPNSCFGNAELKLLASSCPLLHTLKVYYRGVTYTLPGLQHLLRSCVLLKTLALPFGGAKLFQQLQTWASRAGRDNVVLSPCWVTTLRLHNMAASTVSNTTAARLVPQLFRNSLTTLRLVNVKHLRDLDFLSDLPWLRHLAVKHCRRPPLKVSLAHTPGEWLRSLAPQLETLCMVDADHVVCEQMVLRSVFLDVDDVAFGKLKELRMDNEGLTNFFVNAHLRGITGVLCEQCTSEQHRFRTWERYERCTRCRASSSPKIRRLETIYFYNASFFPLHDTVLA